MDLEKLVKFVEGFGRDYVLTILSLLWNPYSVYADGAPVGGTAEATLNIYNGRTFSYGVISVGLGTVLYSAALGHEAKLSEISIPPVLLTFLLWFLLAGCMHRIVKAFGSIMQYSDTVSVCLRVMPLAYVLSSLFVFAISVFAKPYLRYDEAPFLLALAFLGIQLLILAVYLPAGLRRVHRTSAWSQVVMTIGLVLFVATVNIFAMGFLVAPPMMRAPAMIS
jgi:hypothetical protein